MTYKKHLIFLLSIISVLVLLYTVSLILNSNLGNARSDNFVWLDSKIAARAGRIVITGAEDDVILVKENGSWFVLNDGVSYPARQMRVEDLLSFFTKRASWPVRSSSASTHSRFGLDEQNSFKITIYNESMPLISLLVGYDDPLQRETYFRKAGENVVRSGAGSLKAYITSPVAGWYNLRLIPESEGGQIDVDSVQRLSVFKDGESQIFTRSNREWNVTGIELEKPNKSAIDNYIRIILNTEADNFDDTVSADDNLFNGDRIELQLGTGRIIIIRLSKADESGRHFASVSTSDLVYSVPVWAANRLFVSAQSLESQ